MTTPAPTVPIDLTPATNKAISAGAPPRPPADADMIEAMFHAFGFLVPGAVTHAPQGIQALTDDILSHLGRHGAADSDLDVIRGWLTARQE